MYMPAKPAPTTTASWTSAPAAGLLLDMDCEADIYRALPLDSDLLQPAFYPQGESARAKTVVPGCGIIAPDSMPHGEEALSRHLEPWATGTAPILRDAAKMPLLRMRWCRLACTHLMR